MFFLYQYSIFIALKIVFNFITERNYVLQQLNSSLQQMPPQKICLQKNV